MALEQMADTADAVLEDRKMKSATLLALAKAGDENAYAELVKQASSVASRAVGRILNTEADTEDALQEAAMRSYFSLSTFDGRAQFSTWFTRIAINSALMILRKHRRSCEVAVLGDPKAIESLVNSVPDPRPSPLEIVRSKQEYEVLHHAIDSLPLILRQSLQVRCSDDLPISEIAARLQLSLPATKTRLLRAKRNVVAKASTELLPNSREKRMLKKQNCSSAE
jgi:RNA polymerase sigma-70 factor (ECF subfamily)